VFLFFGASPPLVDDLFLCFLLLGALPPYFDDLFYIFPALVLYRLTLMTFLHFHCILGALPLSFDYPFQVFSAFLDFNLPLKTFFEVPAIGLHPNSVYPSFTTSLLFRASSEIIVVQFHKVSANCRITTFITSISDIALIQISYCITLKIILTVYYIIKWT
jgi:hypothetical protein